MRNQKIAHSSPDKNVDIWINHGKYLVECKASSWVNSFDFMEKYKTFKWQMANLFISGFNGTKKKRAALLSLGTKHLIWKLNDICFVDLQQWKFFSTIFIKTIFSYDPIYFFPLCFPGWFQQVVWALPMVVCFGNQPSCDALPCCRYEILYFFFSFCIYCLWITIPAVLASFFPALQWLAFMRSHSSNLKKNRACSNQSLDWSPCSGFQHNYKEFNPQLLFILGIILPWEL